MIEILWALKWWLISIVLIAPVLVRSSTHIHWLEGSHAEDR